MKTQEPEIFYTLKEGISELIIWSHDDIPETFTITLFDDGSGELDVDVDDTHLETLAISSFTRTSDFLFITAEGRQFALPFESEA